MQKRILNRIISKIFRKENRLFLYLSFIIILILFLSTFANKWSSGQTIKKFIITGNTIIPQNELLGNVDSTLLKRVRNDVELLDLKDKIISHPFILTTYVMQRNASVIEIEVKERIPVGLLVRNDGSLCYCDDGMEIIPYRLSIKFDGLPVLRNFFNKNKLDSAALSGVLKILEQSKKSEFAVFYRLISEIEYDRNSKIYTIITADNAYSIFFGRADNIRTKLDLICDFLENAIQEINTNDIKYVDLRWEDRVIVQTKQEIINTTI